MVQWQMDKVNQAMQYNVMQCNAMQRSKVKIQLKSAQNGIQKHKK